MTEFDPAALDRQIDPCADFHAHVCSKWMAANPIPADQAVWGTGSSLQIWNETVLRKTMEQASAPDPKRSAVQQRIGDYWHACMDEEGLARRGLAPVAQPRRHGSRIAWPAAASCASFRSGVGEYAPMPPVFGPASPSSARL